MLTKNGFPLQKTIRIIIFSAFLLFVGYWVGKTGFFGSSIRLSDPFLNKNLGAPSVSQQSPNHCANEKLYDNLDDALVEINNVCILDLSYQHLKVLPSDITKLSHLVELRLDNNDLTELPPEISRLTDLQVLTVRNNQLATLPSQIGALQNLQILSLRNNKIERLPPEIKNLTQLKTLGLRDNKLSSLRRSV